MEVGSGTAYDRIEERVGWVELVIRVRDEEGNPVTGYEAEFLVQGGPSLGKWELDATGQKTVYLRSTNIVSYIIFKGPGVKTSARLKDGLRRNTEVVFTLTRGPHKEEVGTAVEQ
ncbi:MAG: hypothetical protein HY314_03930 [Acidobacteria bacterium]|nr:hypothetical protein [Acidobacteriota bacterium]